MAVKEGMPAIAVYMPVIMLLHVQNTKSMVAERGNAALRAVVLATSQHRQSDIGATSQRHQSAVAALLKCCSTAVVATSECRHSDMRATS